MTTNHMNSYIKSGKAEIVAVSDVNEKATKDFIAKYALKAKYYSNYKDLLADTEVQAVSICAPNKYHGEITVATANAKKHSMAEKPFVTNVDEAKKSYEAIKNNGVKYAVGYHRRFNPHYKEMKKLKEEGKLRKKPEWEYKDVDDAVRILLKVSTSNFDVLIKNLENSPEFYETVYDLIIEGSQRSFNINNPQISHGFLYGIFDRGKNEKLRIHNRIYEQLLYDYMSSKQKKARNGSGRKT